MALKDFTTRRVVYVAIIAALYIVFTLAIAPISYGPIQLRISEALKVLVLFDPWLALGITIGTFFANLASPFAGPWDLLWMPLTDLIGGILAWSFYHHLLHDRWPALPMTFYALTTGASVALMLNAFGLGNFWFLAATISLSELIILITAIPIMTRTSRWLKYPL